METTTSSGTGSISLGGAKTGYRSFSAAFTTGDVVYYCIVGGTEWETGYGTVTTGTPWTLSRTVIFASSNANNIVTFSVGTKDVFCTAPAGANQFDLVPTTVKTGNYTAQVNDHIRINSTGGTFIITLPAAPNDGDEIGFLDVAGQCATYPVLVAPAGGKTIALDATGVNLNINNASCKVMYNSALNDWSFQQTPFGMGGNVLGSGSTSVDGELALYSGITGTVIKRATQTGVLKATSGVLTTATAGTDYLVPPSGTAMLKAGSGGALVNAVDGTDYMSPVKVTDRAFVMSILFGV